MAEWKPKPARFRHLVLTVQQAVRAYSLCNAAHECLFQSKIFRDIAVKLGLVCLDNREGREQSAFLRGQSLGRMRSRRGHSLPPEFRKRIGRVQLQGFVPCIFFWKIDTCGKQFRRSLKI
jgi:hypothetical protein